MTLIETREGNGKMLRQKHTIVSLIMILLLTGILAACSGGNNTAGNSSTPPPAESTTPPPSETTPPPSETTPPPPEPVELAAYSNHSDDDFNARIAAAVTAAHPNITFKHYPSQIRNIPDTIDVDGVNPDVGFNMNANDWRAIVKLNLSQDLTALAAAAGFKPEEKFFPGTLQTMKTWFDGELKGLPNTANPLILFYNKDIFDAFQVPYPGEDLTWDQLYEIAQKVTGEKNGKKYIGFGAFHSFIWGNNQYSLSLVDTATDTAAVNTPEFKKMVENLIRFYRIPGVADGYDPEGNGGGELNRFYLQQDVAMVATLASSVGRGDWPAEFTNWDMVAAPYFADKPYVGFQDGGSFNAVLNTAKNQEAAFQAMVDYYSEDNLAELAKTHRMIFPFIGDKVKKALGENEKFVGKNVNAFYTNDYAPTPKPTQGYSVDAAGLFAKQFSKLVTGVHKDVDAMLAAAEADINNAIKDAK